MNVGVREVGSVLAAILVTGIYWFYGAALTLFSLSQVVESFFWLDNFRLLFYTPGVVTVAYLYLLKRERGLFLSSLAFLLSLSLAIFWTMELIVYF